MKPTRSELRGARSLSPRRRAGLWSVAVLGLPIALLLSTGAGAATNPTLGSASTFGILSSTYSNTSSGTTITGDLGYTTGPATAPTVSGTTHVADGTYNQAGTDQGSALASLNGQACTYTFPAGAVDLATDTSHGTIRTYTPGVYCTTASSAASIGTAGIVLNGSGTYIFRIDGALTSAANSSVTVAGGASACDVYWTPTAATTLGANSSFLGTNIDASGITIGSTVNWTGRALAFGGTVSTASDTIAVPACTTSAVTTTTVAPATTTTTVAPAATTTTTVAPAAATTTTTSPTKKSTTTTSPPKKSTTTTTVPSATTSPISPAVVPVTG